MNRLFVAYKPSGISSNRFLGQLKRKYGIKKAGFSGTLDPFAKGVLIVAFGAHTKLFRFLDKTPKTYRATLWLGAHSDTLDIEAVTRIDKLETLDIEAVEKAVISLKGELSYHPPIFSAKRINGQRAYDLAREGKKVVLNTDNSTIHDIRLLHYCHPFITFEATVSEGTYIRSLGKLICEKLSLEGGVLSALERLSEGQFCYNDEKALDIKKVLNIPRNRYEGDPEKISKGQKLALKDFKNKEDGICWIDNGENITVLEFDGKGVHYLLNMVNII
jgi:tRNA pseudouridine55 synthase